MCTTHKQLQAWLLTDRLPKLKLLLDLLVQLFNLTSVYIQISAWKAFAFLNYYNLTSPFELQYLMRTLLGISWSFKFYELIKISIVTWVRFAWIVVCSSDAVNIKLFLLWKVYFINKFQNVFIISNIMLQCIFAKKRDRNTAVSMAEREQNAHCCYGKKWVLAEPHSRPYDNNGKKASFHWMCQRISHKHTP